MGFNVIRIPEKKLPFTYPPDRYVEYNDIDSHIYCKENESRYGGSGGFHPARTIAVLLGLYQNKDAEKIKKYSDILLENSIVSEKEILFLYKFISV